ncbi:gas vesicle protein GvpJ [Promicromonospora kroppenstedtii]|uniref:gas vesicle protein GvpJ n=1 Tax=Promicromonospora kroppenstedtii TaxID=440482 RepID=UPI000562B024|nr:gas vesicle protein GvpJ [Promicromonospora kroppenstedtii]
MTELSTRPRSSGYLQRPSSSSLADVINIILDKGLVIDAFVRVSLVGIEVITIDARIVIASVDTYLRFAEATNRLDLAKTGGRDLPELVEDVSRSGAKGKTKGVLASAKEALVGSHEDKDESQDTPSDEDEGDDDADTEPVPRRREQRRPRRRVSGERSR